MEYVNYVKSKAAHIGPFSKKSETPVLSDEDEHFMKDIAATDGTQGRDAQVVLMDGAQGIPLPKSPDEVVAEPESMRESTSGDHGSGKLHRPQWSWLRRDSRDLKRKNQSNTADSLMDVAHGMKAASANADSDEAISEEAKKEQEDMAAVLEQLNLTAVNNRVFSISDETHELLQKFSLIFKDLINGVPTAYGDLEALLKGSDKQLQKTYESLPTFLQKLIAQLPERMKETIAPQMVAAAAAAASQSTPTSANAAKASTTGKGKKSRIPGLRDIVGKPGAVAGMLRSIITFLRARFPLFLGMNVIWSLALFVLLFVLWYCHKRGKEVRLEKERQLTEQELAQLGASSESDIQTTTAPAGASLEEIKEGIREVQIAREAAAEEERMLQEEPSASKVPEQPAGVGPKHGAI